jgi:hypothetical protein
MRRTLAVLSILFAAAGIAAAGGLEFQIGGGYQGAFGYPTGTPVRNLPLGLTAFADVGYRFGGIVSAGAEYQFGAAWSLEPVQSLVSNMILGYLKIRFTDLLTVAGLAGASINSFVGRGTQTVFTAGFRITVLFLYGEANWGFPPEGTYTRVAVGVRFALG